MLSAILEILLAILAAVGLAGILWMLWARCLLPLGGEDGRIAAVVCGCGDGAGVEQSVRSLLRLRRCNLYHGLILILDCGLDEQGRALARLLCANSGEVMLCDESELSDLIFSA